MKYKVFFITAITIVLLIISCEIKLQEPVPETIEQLSTVMEEETLQATTNIDEEKPAKRRIQQGKHYILNSSIYYTPTEEEEKEFEAARKAAREADNSNLLQEIRRASLDIWDPKNIQRDFSDFDIHPLGKFLGKWRQLDYYGNMFERGSYYEIYKDGDSYKYSYDGIDDTGQLEYMINGAKVFWREQGSEYVAWGRIIGEPFKSNNSLAFHLFVEGPQGNYQLETEADADDYAKPIDFVNGSWLGQYRLVDGTPIEKRQYSWGRGFSLLDTSTEFDLGHRLVIMPGFGVFAIEEAYKDEEGSICIKAIPMINEAGEDSINIRITFLDYNKAYITHDKWEVLDDKRYSPEEKWPWYRLSGPEGD